MSGVVGIINFDSAPIEPELVKGMTGAMHYRGPDGIRHWVRGPVALGQCMLCTTPESLEEEQPLANEDESLVLVMDGRVDNWKELRRELSQRRIPLRTRADAELVLRAYEVWGTRCLQHIEGDFALVIWDACNGTAFCARDRVGNKPFHYHWNGRTLSFASEVHAILALPWVRRELNQGMVADFLAARLSSREETFWVGVSRLVAAHQLVVSDRGPQVEQYWEPNASVTLPCRTEDEFAEYYRTLLTEVVRRMSRSHRPLACDVSGGLDSSAIFAVAENLRLEQSLLAASIEGYTLDFHDDDDANELQYVGAVEAHWGRTIRRIRPSYKPLSWYRDWATRYREFPGYPNSVMGLGMREQARRDGCRVSLDGTGGDEWLIGHRTYYADALAAGQWRQIYRFLKEDSCEAGVARSIGWFLRHGVAPQLPEFVKRAVRQSRFLAPRERIDGLDWLAPAMRQVLDARILGPGLSPKESRETFGRRILSNYWKHTYLTLAREMEERLAASVGIELRAPLWDTNLIEFAFATPQHLRLRGHMDKILHRRAMAGLLPPVVLERRTKAGFSVAFERYLREMETELTRTIPARRKDWVESCKAADVFLEARRPGFASWMLWGLFGCDALL